MKNLKEFVFDLSHFGPNPLAETKCMQATIQDIYRPNFYEKCFNRFILSTLTFHLDITFVLDVMVFLCFPFGFVIYYYKKGVKIFVTAFFNWSI